MKKVIPFAIAFLIFSSCTHRIVRTGYDVSKPDHTNCEIIIKKNFHLQDSIGIKLGEIKLGETGFAVACSEAHAINILTGEACALKADLIIIRDEKRPDFWSSCYRCNADFYQFHSPYYKTEVKSDDEYNQFKLQNRVSDDRNKNAAIAAGALLGGFVFGFLFFQQ